MEGGGEQIVVGFEELPLADVIDGRLIDPAAQRHRREQVHRHAAWIDPLGEEPRQHRILETRAKIQLLEIEGAAQRAIRADFARQRAGHPVLEPGIVVPAAAAVGVADIEVPGKIAAVAFESEVERGDVVFHRRDRIAQFVAHDHRLGDSAKRAEGIGGVVRMHKREELAVAIVVFVFPAAEIELVGRARRAEGVAEVKIEQAVAVDLGQGALGQQVLGGPVAVVAQMGLDDAVAVGVVGRRAPGQALAEQVAVRVGHHRNRRFAKVVDIDESVNRAEALAAGWREQRWMHPAIAERAFIAG